MKEGGYWNWIIVVERVTTREKVKCSSEIARKEDS